MAPLDLSGLSSIFSNENIEKIFHAAEYDILCMKRDYGFEFSHLFDTMQAARILGMEKLGLSSLLSDLLGVEQGKSFQKADWGRRPVPEEMREYARLDTHYLLSLRNILADRLKEQNLMDLAREDFRRLCLVEHSQRDAPLYTQVGGYHLLDPQALAVLEELCQFRDQRAQKLNRPHFKVIGNNALLAAAESLPRSVEDLKKIEVISFKILERYQREILDAVKKGLARPPIHLEKHHRPSQSYIDRLQKLQDWRKNEGKKLSVQSDIVLPRDILEDIAAKNPHDLQELEALMAEVPWRFTRFGRDIIKVIEKVK
jgi:ribonuclease D